MDTQWILNLFGIIGIVIAVVVLVIAMIWLLCFIVRLLVKTFGVKVKSSYELMVEDITKKAKAKRLRNEQKRKAKNQEKQEILNMKLASNHKIFLMKRQKLQKELEAKENEEKQKNLGEDIFFEQAQEQIYQNNQKMYQEELEADISEEPDENEEIDLNVELEEPSVESNATPNEESSDDEKDETSKETNEKPNEEETTSNESNSSKSTFNQGINIIDALAKEEKEDRKNKNKK